MHRYNESQPNIKSVQFPKLQKCWPNHMTNKQKRKNSMRISQEKASNCYFNFADRVEGASSWLKAVIHSLRLDADQLNAPDSIQGLNS